MKKIFCNFKNKVHQLCKHILPYILLTPETLTSSTSPEHAPKDIQEKT
nr:MAG: hypothetical protein ADFBMEEK_00046 [Peromyscus leucopus gammaherpesvirus]